MFSFSFFSVITHTTVINNNITDVEGAPGLLTNDQGIPWLLTNNQGGHNRQPENPGPLTDNQGGLGAPNRQPWGPETPN